MRTVVFMVLSFSLSNLLLASESQIKPAYEEVIIAKNVMVPMRDGVRLATDIYRPGKNGEVVQGKLPTLLSRTPYGKHGAEVNASFFAQHGYAVAVQDVRGRYDSEGEFYIYVNEGRDGYDAINWVASQPWSRGKVATFGGSYLAATQHALAREQPESLEAMFVTVSTSNYFEDGAGAGGAFALLHNLVYALNLASTSKEAMAEPSRQTALKNALMREPLEAWLGAYPFGPNASPLAVIPSYQKWFQDWVDHSSFDDYWKQNGYTFELSYDKYADIPVYHVGGWYDIFLRGTLNNHAGLADRNKSLTRLMIGPWEHGVGPRITGDADFGESAEVKIRDEQLKWFGAMLKGEHPEAFEKSPVDLFLMGGGDGKRSPDGKLRHGGEWLSLNQWPPRMIEAQRYYFHANGLLDKNPPSAPNEPSAFVFDPKNPVPSIGGKINSGDDLVPSGPWNQRCVEDKVSGCKDNLPLSARSDVLVFQTPPLEEDVVIIGPVSVKLWVSSSARDTDFTAKLVDVYPSSEDYPEGYDLLLADRIQRARFRNGPDQEDLLVPGEVFELTVDLVGVANRFQKGHRIRVDISSSNFPFFDVNPNTGERLGHHTHTLTANNKVFHGPRRASHLLLSVGSLGQLAEH